MIKVFLAIALTLTPCQVASQVSDDQKKDFINLLKTLPHKGEFYTEEAVKKASPYLPVLFALTRKDIKGYDVYPFAAISRGLCEHKKHRDYAVRHFGEIRHPELKLFWAAMLFKAESVSPEVVQFLRSSLDSEKRAKFLSEIIGPEFGEFKRRVKAYPAAQSQ
jgi:hypothetical protein